MDTPNWLEPNASARKPTWPQIRQILLTSKTIAVVGFSHKPHRPSRSVSAYLQGQGYRIIPVNPRLSEVSGEKAYASVRDIPEPVDIVLVFRRSEDVPPVVEDAIAKGAKVVWMQLGISNQAAALQAEAAGLQVVMDTCIAVVHRMLPTQGEI